MDAREVLALFAQSSAAEVVGLSDWLGRHPASTRFRLRGERIGHGQVQSLLLAKIEPHPPRWKHDRWPLGAVLRLEDGRVANEEVASAPRHLRGRVGFDRERRHIRGRVEALGHDGHLLAFWLGTSAADVESLSATCDGHRLRFVREAGLWATSIPEPPCDVQLIYEVAVESAGFDHWDEQSLVLSRKSFLPGPVIVGSGTQIDVLLQGMDDWVVRSAGGEHRTESGWEVSGTADALTFIAAQSEWARTTAVIEGVQVDVATKPERHPQLAEIHARAEEALRAISGWGDLPEEIRITEVPEGRAPVTGDSHIALPISHSDYNPLGLAHELVHTLFHEHVHPPGGLPGVEEPLAELLSLRAARDDDEIVARRRQWQHLMHLRDVPDGRALVDAYRRSTDHYFRGALVLGALEKRIGGQALRQLLSPLPERGPITWPELARRVRESHPRHAEWFRTLITTSDLPRPGLEVHGGRLRIVDAADTGVEVALTVEYHNGDGLLSGESVQLGAPIHPPPDGEWVIFDPPASAVIRRPVAGEWRVVLPRRDDVPHR